MWSRETFFGSLQDKIGKSFLLWNFPCFVPGSSHQIHIKSFFKTQAWLKKQNPTPHSENNNSRPS